MISGAIFYDILMVRLSSQRFLRKYDSRTFANQIGKQVLPTFLSIIDNPLRSFWGKTPLSSHYLFDDEWVPARRLVMVKDGILKNFYLSRKPYKQYKHSNGHGRFAFYRNPFSRPGITIVKSKRSYSLKELRKQLIKEIKRQGKRYGYILKRFQGYSKVRRSVYSLTPTEIYRLDIKTNKLTQLKGLQVRTAALQVIRGILATGNDYRVFNGGDNEDSGSIQISTIAPSLLIRRISFQRKTLAEKKTFTLTPPFKASDKALLPPPSTTKKAFVCPKTCPKVCRCPACQAPLKK